MSESCHPIAGNMVAGKWQLGRKIGSGAFGDVYEGQRLNTSDRVAIKLQHKRHKEEEWRVLKEVIGCEGLPQIYHMGWEKDYHAIVMQMLGDNLETLCEQCKRSFSTDTVAWIAIHCLRMLEALHVKGYVHADVKPDNFLIGTDPTRHQLYMVDLGLAMRYRHASNGRHVAQMQNPDFFRGTLRYASLNIHSGSTLSRRDDLESLAYVLIYLHQGRLPWQGTLGTEAERRMKVRDIKRNTKMQYFRDKKCPGPLVDFLEQSRNLHFDEDPPYKTISTMFTKMLASTMAKVIPDWAKKPGFATTFNSNRKRPFVPLDQLEPAPKKARPILPPMMLLTVAQEKDPPRSQSYIHSSDFKEVREWIVKRWNHDTTVYRITALCFSDTRWHCVMTSHSDYTVQSIKQSGSVQTMKEWINKKWKEGFFITSVAGGDGSYVVVASKGTPFTQQKYKLFNPWPETWVKEQWNEGYRITELATIDDEWMVILSKDSGIRKQCWEIHPTYPSDVVHRRWESGLRITCATSVSDRLCIIMSRCSDYDSQHEVLRRSNTWPSDWVKEMWADNHFLTTITPFPAATV